MDTLINLHLFCLFTISSCTTVNNHSFSIQCKPQFPRKATSPGMIFIPQPIASINPLLIENLSGSNPRIAKVIITVVATVPDLTGSAGPPLPFQCHLVHYWMICSMQGCFVAQFNNRTIPHAVKFQ